MHRATTQVLRLFVILPYLVISTAFISTVFISTALFPSASFAKLPPPALTDMRVLIDISGSMKKNDPNNLRIPALKLLLNLMPRECNAGVWTFGRYVNMLVPFRAVTPQWKNMAKREANKINYAGQFTNIGSAMEKASFGWTKADPNTQRSMILLTDGMVDISRDNNLNEKERKRILEVLLPRLKRAGVKIHTIALSQNADVELLQTLALSTDGEFAVVNNADELLKVFVAAFDQSVEQEQVPITGNRFSIDGSVDEFTVLIFRIPGSIASQLKMPNGKVVSQNDKLKDMNWFSDSSYDLITINQPLGGEWTLLADVDPDNRVTVVSDLKLSMSGLPTNIVQSEVLEMSVSLSEGDVTIRKPEFLSLLDITFRQQYFDGDKTWEGKLTSHLEGKVKIPKNGVYTARLNKTLLPGHHELTVIVDGKTFQRKKKLKLTVHKEVLEVLIVEEEDEDGGPKFFLNILPKGGIIPKEELVISAKITKPMGSLTTAKAKSTPFGGWRVDIKNDGGIGIYRVMLEVNSAPGAARKISLMQGPYNIDYQVTGAMNSDPVTEIGAESTTMESVQKEPDVEKVEPEIEPMEAPEDGADGEELFMEETVEEETPVEEEDVGFEEESTSIIDMIKNMNKMVLAGIVAGINLVLFGFGFIIYRKIMSRKDLEDDEDDLEIVASESDDDEDFDLSDTEDENQDEFNAENEDTVVAVEAPIPPAVDEPDLGVSSGDEHDISTEGDPEVEKAEPEVDDNVDSDEFDLEADLAALVEEDTETDITLDDIEEKLSGPDGDDETDEDLSL
ncbi:MAG: VWA domain-containing protein [Pseudomonadales bacterium]|nr:VWA domain-containing protein [Pseudomonadales bacterium]